MSLDDLNYMQRYLVEEEAEHLEEGSITRREFVRRITLLIGSAVAAGPILMAYGCGPEDLTPTTSAAATPTTAAATATTAASATTPASSGDESPFHVPEDDPAVSASMVDIPTAGAAVTLMGYLAVPANASGRLAGVIVNYENRGLTPHIQDVVRRVAKAGYVGLCVDLLSRQGGTAAMLDDAAVTAALGQATPEQNVADLSSGLDFLKAHEQVDGEKLAAVGFCFGGGMTWRLATTRADLKAAVPYYGPNPPLEEVPNIEAAVLGIYGGNDSRINAGLPAIEEALEAAGVVHEIQVYDGANHAFNNDTSNNYNPTAAQDAWNRTLAWFQTYLV